MSDRPATQTLLGAAFLAAGRPLNLRELGQLLQLNEADTRAALTHFTELLAQRQLGFELEAVAGGYRLVVPPELAASLAAVLSPAPLPALSTAALEVLAIIAYKQPITRAEIEAMRGGSAGTVITLQERELIKVVGRSSAVGQPLLYGTTDKFLVEFGLSSLDALPPLEDQAFAHLLRG